MLTLRLPPDMERRLDRLTRKAGRTKSALAREAILRHVEDIEDFYLAEHRLRRGGPRLTLDEVERGRS
jgi:RHH-type rel operon transcriptional repressor/antitoxin RelB